ncbi:hypothetical protein C9374_011506 [Naegleria lovaniensis]|uniref:F-box domain-containing protein n=1 Tax=Naegleria lovaniensis TaxID=51637 RepID=A0AA88KQU8_NAELO|nr:uncharacterized protein C9374_011506 [Naegleria lovaniensis]KAG2392781.1 hypothetical protein C9374_011506 [Naegleria lovaniensis]
MFQDLPFEIVIEILQFIPTYPYLYFDMPRICKQFYLLFKYGLEDFDTSDDENSVSERLLKLPLMELKHFLNKKNNRSCMSKFHSLLKFDHVNLVFFIPKRYRVLGMSLFRPESSTEKEQEEFFQAVHTLFYKITMDWKLQVSELILVNLAHYSTRLQCCLENFHVFETVQRVVMSRRLFFAARSNDRDYKRNATSINDLIRFKNTLALLRIFQLEPYFEANRLIIYRQMLGLVIAKTKHNEKFESEVLEYIPAFSKRYLQNNDNGVSCDENGPEEVLKLLENDFYEDATAWKESHISRCSKDIPTWLTETVMNYIKAHETKEASKITKKKKRK